MIIRFSEGSARAVVDVFFSSGVFSRAKILSKIQDTTFFLLRSPLGTLSEQIFIDFKTEAHFGSDLGPIWGPLGPLREGKIADFP